MGAAPTVSIVIPACHHSEFIGTTLESVLAQTFTDYEVIVVNDGSPDPTAEAVRPYVEARRVSYIEQPNAGVAAARNRGLAAARGQFIAFLDDDDIWPADKLEWQVKELVERPELSAVAGGLAIIDEAGNELFRPPTRESDLTFESLFGGTPLYSPGQVLICSKRISSIGGFDESIWGADDFDIWFRLIKTGPVSVRERCSLLYRVHDSNASNDGLRMFDETHKVLKRHLGKADDDVRPELRKRAHRYLYNHGFSRVLASAKHQLRRGDLTGLPKVAKALTRLAPCAVADPVMLWWLCRDALPRRWMLRPDKAM